MSKKTGMPTGLTATSQSDRLWKCVKIGAAGDCWPWSGLRGPEGYGIFMSYQGRGVRLRKMGAHRFMWELANGVPVPSGQVVRHTCDNPPCCNPNHLVVGTVADNVRDKCERGRQPRGEKNGSSKLSEADVKEIRRRLAAGDKQISIAKAFGVTQANVSIIKIGIGWKHLGGDNG